jgi:outer membrane protein assembly factor BamE (lipoprotein component of BamABCDE complex)
MRYALLAVVVMAGCSSVGNREIADDSRIAKIEKGKSTKADVEALVGKPTTVDFTDGGLEKWLYVYTTSQMRGASFIPVVGIFAGGSDINSDTLTVLFSKEGIVENVGRGKSGGGAGGVQDVSSSGLKEPKP